MSFQETLHDLLLGGNARQFNELMHAWRKEHPGKHLDLPIIVPGRTLKDFDLSWLNVAGSNLEGAVLESCQLEEMQGIEKCGCLGAFFQECVLDQKAKAAFFDKLFPPPQTKEAPDR
ncbi:MAG: hypothetical protein R3B52_02845 [Candidatus Paceibacterota bacterium]